MNEKVGDHLEVSEIQFNPSENKFEGFLFGVELLLLWREEVHRISTQTVT